MIERVPGDFAVCRISGAGGTAVDLMEWLNGGKAFSHWDHVVGYLGGGLCLQAEPGGAQIIRRPVLPGDMWSTGIPSLALTIEQQYRAPDVAEAFRGVPYSWLDYAALAAHRAHIPDLPLWPGRAHLVTLQSFIKDGGHFMCSALIDAWRARLGSHLYDDGRWEGYVTPYDLGHLMATAGGRSTA